MPVFETRVNGSSEARYSPASDRSERSSFAIQTTQTDPAPPRVSVIVPVLNAMRYLPQTLPAVLAAARHADATEVIYVDNGSTDGSLEYLHSLPEVKVLRANGATIGAMRNAGARNAVGDFLSFVDADCLIPEDYFAEAEATLKRTAAEATGCKYSLPADAQWIETVWSGLHYVGYDRDVNYINGGNFFITRFAFDSVGGFSETLRTGEDAEIGLRLTLRGHRIHECTRVKAVHLGNAKSLRAFYRRIVWHGLGMFGTVTRSRLDKPTTMMAVHLLATLVGVAILVGSSATLSWRIGELVALQMIVPAVTVAHRSRQTRRLPAPLAGIFLYWLYYWARFQALLILLAGRKNLYSKQGWLRPFAT